MNLNKLDVNLPVEINQEYNLKDFGWDIADAKLIVKSKNYGETSTGNSNFPTETNRVNKDFKKYKRLNIVSPISFYCRASQVSINYSIAPQPVPPVATPSVTPPENKTQKTLRDLESRKRQARQKETLAEFRKQQEAEELEAESLRKQREAEERAIQQREATTRKAQKTHIPLSILIFTN